MVRDERGSAFFLLLLLSSTMLIAIMGGLPYFSSHHHISAHYHGSLQARSNAEAGVWLVLEDYRNGTVTFGTHSYYLGNGSVEVDIQELEEGAYIEIYSRGTVSSDYKSVINVKYDCERDQIIHWHGVG
jgi:hypothetical protein